MDGAVKRIIFPLLIITLLLLPLAGADTVMIRSAYYGSTASTLDARVLNRSFAAQLGSGEETSFSAQERVLSAIANPSYPVTPGDTMSLSYTDGKNTITVVLQVDGSYRIVIPSFGIVEAKGKTFSQAVAEIEQMVNTYAPFSMPQVKLTGTGTFFVTVKGEVDSTRELPAWGLSRLSSVLKGATDKASTRTVIVESADGKVNQYDVYAALKEGDLSQNPLVSSADVITLVPAQRIVSIVGEVNRSGTYQLLEGEQLSDLLYRYAKGFLPSSERSSVVVRRYSEKGESSLDVVRVEQKEYDTFVLQPMDTVYVDPAVPLSRTISIEGAVNIGEERTSSLSSSGKLYYQFFPQETMSDMLGGIASRFSAVSDLASAYLLRDNQMIPVDIQAILMGHKSDKSSLQLIEGDRLIVPFNQLFVNVTGAVLRPGTFPYIPDKDASYYINLAGGFDPAKNRNGAFTVTDKRGAKVGKSEPVPPEAVVSVKLTTFEALHGMRLATTVSIVGLVSVILSIVLDVPKLFDL